MPDGWVPFVQADSSKQEHYAKKTGLGHEGNMTFMPGNATSNSRSLRRSRHRVSQHSSNHEQTVVPRQNRCSLALIRCLKVFRRVCQPHFRGRDDGVYRAPRKQCPLHDSQAKIAAGRHALHCSVTSS